MSLYFEREHKCYQNLLIYAICVSILKVINNFTFQNNDTEIAKEHTTMGKFTTTAHLNITRADIPDVKHLLDLLGKYVY